LIKNNRGVRFLRQLLAVCLLVLFFSHAVAAADAGQFDLDVIFVIDCSGSMLQSDPEKLALTAAQLFIDMCEDSGSRVGYVMYTHTTIGAPQPLTDLVSFSKELKKAIAATSYQHGGDTDTALGLEQALRLLDARGDTGRKPVVILLSDGNTDLSGGRGSRTTEESLAALEVAKKDLADRGVPVYTIGFNYNGELDMNAMSSIADVTGAKAYSATSAEQLPSLLRDIYGDLTGAKSNNRTEVATGAPQNVPIPIDNDSIYKATITIMSQKEIKDVSLKEPGGATAAMHTGFSPSKNEYTLSANPKYTLLTLYYPTKGEWTLTFTGTKDDVVSIDTISVYDLALVMDLPGNVNYMGADFSWHLEAADGAVVSDPDLLKNLTVIFHANDTKEKEFPKGKQSATISLPTGDYEAYLTLDSEGIIRTSNTQTFRIPEKPVELLEDTVEFTLITIFRANDVILLDEIVEYDNHNKPLDVEYEDGAWEDVVDLDFDDNIIRISAIKSGDVETVVTVTGKDGGAVDFYIQTRVISGLLIIIAAAAVLIIAAGIIILLKIMGKPYLNSPMSGFDIEVILPEDKYELTPAAANLKLERVKQKRSLLQIIQYNGAVSDSYMSALSEVASFIGRVVFFAKKSDYLEVSVPADNRFTVRVNRNKLQSPSSFQMKRGRGFKIELYRNDDVYEIMLGDNNEYQEPDHGGSFSGDAFGRDGGGGGGGGDFDF
jgi:Mg-chelatase subunit ChlD